MFYVTPGWNPFVVNNFSQNITRGIFPVCIGENPREQEPKVSHHWIFKKNQQVFNSQQKFKVFYS